MAIPSSSTARARLLLTLGLAFVFVWFGVDKIVRPLYWIGWIPAWMEGLLAISRNTWLSIFGVVEIVLGFSLLVFRSSLQRIAVCLVILHLLAVISQTGFSDVGIRDIGLLFAAVALLFLITNHQNPITKE